MASTQTDTDTDIDIDIADIFGGLLAGGGERVPPEKVDTTELIADADGLDPARIEQALVAAGRERGQRQEIAKRVMHLAVTGLAVVAVGTDVDDRLVLDLSNDVQDVIG